MYKRQVDDVATAALRSSQNNKELNKSAFGEERMAWEKIFDDKRMGTLTESLEKYPSASRQRVRNKVFGSIDSRLLVPATSKRYDFRELFSERDAINNEFDQKIFELNTIKAC